MTTLTGTFGCLGSWVVRGLLAAGERRLIQEGIRRTPEEFAGLRQAGRLDARELA